MAEKINSTRIELNNDALESNSFNLKNDISSFQNASLPTSLKLSFFQKLSRQSISKLKQLVAFNGYSYSYLNSETPSSTPNVIHQPLLLNNATITTTTTTTSMATKEVSDSSSSIFISNIRDTAQLDPALSSSFLPSTSTHFPLTSTTPSSHPMSSDHLSRHSSLLLPPSPLYLPSSSPSSWFTSFTQWIQRYFNLGLSFMVVNTFLTSIISLSVKVLSSQPYFYPSYELVFIRSMILFTLSSSILKFYYKASHVVFGPPAFRSLLLLRSFLGFIAIVTYYSSLQYLKLGEATLLAFTSPFFVGILGSVILKERWEKLDIFSGILSLFGVCIIALPHLFHLDSSPTPSSSTTTTTTPIFIPSTPRLFAFGLGLFSSLSAAGVVITLRRLKHVPMMHLLATFSFCSMLFSFVMTLALSGQWFPFIVVPSTLLEWSLLILALSLAGFAGQCSMAMALRYETAAKCTSLSFLQLLFSFVLELIILRVPLMFAETLGASIILLSAIFVAFFRFRKNNVTEPKREVKQDYELVVQTLKTSQASLN